MIFHQRFKTGDVVRATSVPNSTLQTWIRRQLIIGQRDSGEEVTGAGSPGNHREFSFRNIMEIAIAKALMDSGIKDVDAVFKVGMELAHTGDAFGHHGPPRIPGLPYHWQEGRTLVGYSYVREMVAVTPWKPNAKADVYLTLRARLGGIAAGGVIMLDMSSVFEQTCARLDLGQAEILNEAYNWQPGPKVGT